METGFAWSAEALADCAKSDILAVNPIIYAEVSIRFEKYVKNSFTCYVLSEYVL